MPLHVSEVGKVIFQSDYDYSREDYVEYLIDCMDMDKESAIEKSNDDNSYYNWVGDMQNMDIDDFFTNIKYCGFDDKVMITGSVGTWRGRREIYAVLADNLEKAIKKCFGSCDEASVSFENGIYYVYARHHDGTNIFEIHQLSKRGEIEVERSKYLYEDYQPKKWWFKKFKNEVIYGAGDLWGVGLD